MGSDLYMSPWLAGPSREERKEEYNRQVKLEAEVAILRDVVRAAQDLRHALKVQQASLYSEQAEAWNDIHVAVKDFDTALVKLQQCQK